MANYYKTQRGMTLLELMVVLAIGAILVVAAIPSFLNMKSHLTLKGAAQVLVGELRTTQADAIRKGLTATWNSPGTQKTYQDFCSANSCVPTDGGGNAAASIGFGPSGYVTAPAVLPFTVRLRSCQTQETIQVQVQRTGRIQTLTAAKAVC
jgi:prepilin-type N-terminal cleavage/methylation domain-containing protein